MALAIPELPRQVRASALLHGADADFVTNAYLALQRQWPDEGGFAHYIYVLSQPGARRADVLREIAASRNARACGVEFIDDLPADHCFRPEEHDALRLLSTSLSLRVHRTAADVDELRRALTRLTAGELARAVEGLVQAQQAHQGTLESRLNALEDAHPAHQPAGSAPADAPGEAAWRHLAAQQMRAAEEVGELRQALYMMKNELAGLREAFDSLHRYTTVELKREVADYVNALAAAQRMQAQASRPHARAGAAAPATRTVQRAAGRAGSPPAVNLAGAGRD